MLLLSLPTSRGQHATSVTSRALDTTRDVVRASMIEMLVRSPNAWPAEHRDDIMIKDETNIEGPKQASYAMSNRDKMTLKILDPLAIHGQVQKVPLGTIAPVSREIVHPRKVNTRLCPGARGRV